MPATTPSIFKPLGLFGTAVIDYKIFLQKLWQDNLQCDELLEAHLQQEFHKHMQKSQCQQEKTILSTHDIHQALTCCTKLVQKIIHAQEIWNLMESKRRQPTVLSTHCIP